MDAFKSNQSVGEIVSIMPRASEIFKQYRFDFCCGGYKPLIDAIRESNLNEGAGNILKKLRKITEDYKVPKDGCSTYFATFDKIKELESDLFEHIHLENNILFKKTGN